MIHLGVLGALILYTMFAWSDSKKRAEEAEKAAEEEFQNSDLDPYAEVKLAEKKDDSSGSMARVGVPLLISVVYGGILFVLYALPMFVDKIGEEMMGSSAEVDDDPLREARAAVAAGNTLKQFSSTTGFGRKTRKTAFRSWKLPRFKGCIWKAPWSR